MRLQHAYRVQRAVVQRLSRDASIAGFKVAATSGELQRKLGVDGPLLGVLMDSGRRAPAADVDAAAFGLLLLEAELGFRFRERVTSPFESTAALQAAVSEVRMVVELADGGFGGSREPRAEDLVAANAGARSFVEGDPLYSTGDLDAVDGRGSLEGLEQLAVRLVRNGRVLAEGRPKTEAGGPWAVLAWAVQKTLSEGYAIEPGQLVITGAIGGPVPARPGAYQVDYEVRSSSDRETRASLSFAIH